MAQGGAGVEGLRTGGIAEPEREGECESHGRESRGDLVPREVRYGDPAEQPPEQRARRDEKHMHHHNRDWVVKVPVREQVLVEEDDRAREEDPLHDQVKPKCIAGEFLRVHARATSSGRL